MAVERLDAGVPGRGDGDAGRSAEAHLGRSKKVDRYGDAGRSTEARLGRAKKVDRYWLDLPPALVSLHELLASGKKVGPKLLLDALDWALSLHANNGDEACLRDVSLVFLESRPWFLPDSSNWQRGRVRQSAITLQVAFSRVKNRGLLPNGNPSPTFTLHYTQADTEALAVLLSVMAPLKNSMSMIAPSYFRDVAAPFNFNIPERERIRGSTLLHVAARLAASRRSKRDRSEGVSLATKLLEARAEVS